MSTESTKKSCCSAARISLAENIVAIGLTCLALFVALSRGDQRKLSTEAFNTQPAVGMNAYEDRMGTLLGMETAQTSLGDANAITIENAIIALAAHPEYLKTVPVGHEPTPPSPGEMIFRQNCAACHMPEFGKPICPELNGRWGKMAEVAGGPSVPFDDAYFTESVKDPAKVIAKGFQPTMPPDVAKDMTDEQLAQLLEYVKTLN